MEFSINVFRGTPTPVSFININNLFHPSTIDGCFAHNGVGLCGGIKAPTKDGKYSWNISPHKDRLVQYTEGRLKLIAATFENSNNW